MKSTSGVKKRKKKKKESKKERMSYYLKGSIYSIFGYGVQINEGKTTNDSVQARQ